MLFQKKREDLPQPPEVAPEGIVIWEGVESAPAITAALNAAGFPSTAGGTSAARADVVIVSAASAALTAAADAVIDERAKRGSGAPVLIILAGLDSLSKFGVWLHERASADRLSGMRLVLLGDDTDLGAEILSRLHPIAGSNCIRMPLAPEVENTGFKYFYMFSDELRAVTRRMKELAENNIARIYLLGGPGIGKTSLAYYYFLSRAKGNFVTINLNAESTGDKAAMKSLLCGHVTGAIPGSQSREGALSFARDGVCFLDESHGVTGVVMQVLMEALDSGQYLPFGATAKRFVECAVIFASNRSWDALRNMIHLDEHARLGATIVSISDLRKRREDMLAVIGAVLAGFARQCTTWKPPAGLSLDAWRTIKGCPWRGNTRTLIRVIETACVAYCTAGSKTPVLEAEHLQQAIELWEPADHPDKDLYASF